MCDRFAAGCSHSAIVTVFPKGVCERIQFFAQRFLQNWSAMDASVTYGGKSDFVPFFLKDTKFAAQNEWRFTWTPPQACQELVPLNIRIGNIEQFAELVSRPAKDGSRHG